MKWLVSILVVAEAVLAGCVLTFAGNLAVLLLAGNSVLLIWSATRWGRKPSCCR